MMFPGSQYMDQSWMGWMIAGSALFWIALAAIVIFAIVRLSPTRDRGSDALAVLDQRFARGEMDAEDYRSRRSLILGR
jgi:putative membrane protein